MSIADIFKYFPNLEGSDFRVTSGQTARYNCISWSLNETDTNIWPGFGNEYYWPRRLSLRAPTIEAFIMFYRANGYECCNSADQEQGYEKVALFALHGQVTHASRQLPNGRWTSKIGRNVDIEHDLCALISNNDGGYGDIVQIMRRKIGS